MIKKSCPYCDKKVAGRTDKVFCSLDCKNKYNYSLRQNTKSETRIIDGYLHRNREILETLMGMSKKEIIEKSTLTRTGFRYDFFTGIYLNKENKQYRLIYNFAWMEFSDQKVLIVRKSK